MTGKITNVGINLLAKKFLGTSSEGAISKFKVGIGETVASIADTDLEIAVPISDGTVNDNGDNQLTGSSGGDNSTDNTTTFKPGAGTSDDTSQNLIANGTNVLKIWTIADLSALGTNITGTKPFGLWFYILDATTLAKFKSSGTCLEIKLGSAVGDYYSLTKELTDLAVGWNWITSNTVNVEDLTETGTVAGNIDTFIIEVTTNNAADAFIAGDVLYDLLRTWATSDLIKSMDTNFPSYNSSTKEIASQATLSLLEANGFPLTEIAVENVDGTAWSRDTFTSFSKSNTEELKFAQKDLFNNT